MLKLIPKHQNGYHIVKSGDTFSGIAKKYGTTQQTLEQLNPQIKNIDRLSIGDTVYYLPQNKITQTKTIDGIKVQNTTSSVDLTPVNMDKFNTIVNHNGALLKVDNGLLTNLDNYLISKNVGLPQRQAILYSVVQEGSTTGDHGNGAYGYLGWRGARIPGKGVDQMQYLYDTVFGAFNANHWNNGGAGSGYKTGRAAQQSFINAKTVQDALRALNYGYVRPDLSISRFRSTNGASYFQSGGPIKKVAHKINEHGKQVNTPKPQSYEDFKHGLEQMMYSMHYSGNPEVRRISDEFNSRYKQQYKEKYPWFPNEKQRQARVKIFEQIFQEKYQKYLKDFYNNPHNKPSTNSENAAALAVGGGAYSLIPHPFTRILGGLATIPDLIYDWAAEIDEPKPSNLAHGVVDILPYVAKLIPGKIDDYVAGGLSVGGNVDDAVSANGNDVFNFLNPKSNVNKGDRTDR